MFNCRVSIHKVNILIQTSQNEWDHSNQAHNGYIPSPNIPNRHIHDQGINTFPTPPKNRRIEMKKLRAIFFIYYIF